MDASLSYNYALVVASVIIAVIARHSRRCGWRCGSTASLSTFIASLIAGVAVNGMHYTGMAAVQAHAAPGLVVNTADTASATAFLLPLILGLSGVGFIFSAIIALSPTAAEIVEEGELMKRIGQSQAAQAAQSQAGRYEPRGWQPPPSQPYQPYQAPRNEPEPDQPGSLFRPRRPSDQRLMLVIERMNGLGRPHGRTCWSEPGAKRPGRSEE
mgnify:CR=1 FL=1